MAVKNRHDVLRWRVRQDVVHRIETEFVFETGELHHVGVDLYRIDEVLSGFDEIGDDRVERAGE